MTRRKGCGMGAVAVAWLFRQGTCPIVRLNSIRRIEESLEALEVELSDEEVDYLEVPYQPLAVQAI